MDGRPLIVVGHKNPDTDSICAAIAYANLKSAMGTEAYPYRAGNLNAQTRYVLERFGVSAPALLTDVYPRLSDIMIDERLLITVRPREAVGRARSIMLKNRFSFLPVIDDRGRCLGKVSLLGLAAAPEHLTKFGNGHQITFYPEEFLTRSGGRGTAGRVLPAVWSGVIVAPVIDGTPAARAPTDSAGGPRLFILSETEPAGIPESAAGDIIILFGSSGSAADKAAMQARSPALMLFVPATLLRVVVALYESCPLEEHLESAEPLFHVHDLVRRTEREINRSNAGGFIVTDDDGIVRGVITRLSFLNQTQFQVVLVDHNELSQAVDGVEHAEIIEVIDHHRIGARSTETPITFINKVVGSTCTIIAEMYRNYRIDPDPGIAGLMLSAILSDTVVLKSPTCTQLDLDIASWLSGLAGVEIEAYGEQMFAAGSELSSTPAAALIRQDQKIYSESGFKFAVSQIEMVGFKGFHERSTDITRALEESRESLGCDFACLLVTDITRETSLLLFTGSERVRSSIQYPQAGEHLFEMHNMLSRKKQLMPYLLDVLKNM